MQLIPLIYLSFKIKGNVEKPKTYSWTSIKNPTTKFERNLIFYLGVAGLLFVPVFKIITHLPPYVGMIVSLGVLWIVTNNT